MIPAAFDYVRATSVRHAIDVLVAHSGAARVLAGGHTLLPTMRLRMSTPEVLIDIGRLDDLRGVSLTGNFLRIGAATTHAEVGDHPLVAKHFPLMVEAASVLADALVRNRGTIGGSIANADPAADWPAVMLALDVEIDVEGPKGARSIPIAEFFVGLFETRLATDEVLVAIRIPLLPDGARSLYQKVRHPASGYAMCGIACVLLVSDGVCVDCRVAVTGIGLQAYRATALENHLQGEVLSEPVIRKGAQLVTQGVEISGDGFAGEQYKQSLAAVTTRRAITRARESFDRSTTL